MLLLPWGLQTFHEGLLGWLLPGVPPPASLPAAGSELRRMRQERSQSLIQDSTVLLKQLNYRPSAAAPWL